MDRGLARVAYVQGPRWSQTMSTNHEHRQRRDSRGPTEPHPLTQESGVAVGGCQTAKQSGSGTRAKSLLEATVSGASLGKRPEQGGLSAQNVREVRLGKEGSVWTCARVPGRWQCLGDSAHVHGNSHREAPVTIRSPLDGCSCKLGFPRPSRRVCVCVFAFASVHHRTYGLQVTQLQVSRPLALKSSPPEVPHWSLFTET